MDKDNSKRRRNRVSKDFEASLRTMIRSLSIEEINIIGAYEKPDQRKNFYPLSDGDLSSNISENRRSVFRNKSFNKYELVVDSSTNTLKKEQNKGELLKLIHSDAITNVEENIFTRPILKTELSKESNITTKHKTSKYLQRFFPTFTHSNIPFERTGIQSLPYHLHIEMENGGKHMERVKEYDTIDTIKRKIYKHKSIRIEQQALFYKGERLEGSSMLYSCGIKSNSQVQLKLCNSITIHGNYNSTRISWVIYTSLTVYKLKEMFATSIALEPARIELKYKGKLLEENKELFIYEVSDGGEIEIAQIVRRKSLSSSVGYEVANKYIEMTDNLTKCSCRKLRIDTIAKVLILYNEEHHSTDQIRSCQEFLKEFDVDRDYHHMTCFKLKSIKMNGRLMSDDSSISGLTSTSYNGSDNSLKSAVIAETKRVERHRSLKIETEYVKLLAESRDFKIFKHLLRVKIGTVCNLRSVALLYKYCREIVRYIGLDEKEKSDAVDKILDFTKIYFKKYFMKDIIDKGGLDALTLSGSDIDE